jgi:dipeptidyl aminopeptidase/acylaminoacyl peptidase
MLLQPGTRAVRMVFVFTAIIAMSASGMAQQRGAGASRGTTTSIAPRALTAQDYARAEKFMGYNTNPLVFRSGVRPNWLPDESFWYRVTTPEGSEFVLIDPAKETRGPAFDHAKLAAGLSAATETKIEGAKLPFMTFEFAADMKSISLFATGRRWSCDLQSYQCAAQNGGQAGGADAAQGGRGGRGGRGGGGGRGGRNESLSPDGKRAAFIRDYNMWVRDVATNKETQLTTDGVKDFGYATDNAGWVTSDRPILRWSPDSKKIATYQQDQRGVGEMYLVNTQVGHPELKAWKYPLPGDAVITTIQRVIIEVDGPKVIRLQMPADQHRSSLCDDITCGGDVTDMQWSPDGARFAFVSTSRDHKQENLRIADAAAGAVTEVYEEKSPTYFESGIGATNWRYLPDSNEFIWYTQKSDWGHLYLYDLSTGKLKNQITSGDWNVTQVVRINEKDRVIYFLGVGKEKGRNPYFAHLYSIGFDGNNLALLTPEDGNHSVSLSPSGRYFVDSYSKPDVAPVAVLRDRGGKLILKLEIADISKLLAAGWKPPVPITVKARDGVTDIYGLMFRPTNLVQGRKYPIINHIYPGPQTGSVGGWSFSAARGDDQAVAELGFVVVEIDGMGTPWRSKKFQDAYFADMGDNTLPDQVTAMKQLAQKYSWIDIRRAGIYGHSGGGFATADAMFRYPDFFKVGISESGNHDNREYEDDWGEKYQGLLEKKADGSTSYDGQANQLLAKNLKGHLLLAHGTMDNNVPPNNTLLVVDALIKANKDFDLLMLPNQSHGYGVESNYMTRRRWDYFVRYLLEVSPPKEYEMRPPAVPGGPPPGM